MKTPARAAAVAALCVAVSAFAQESRMIRPVERPGAARAALPNGAIRIVPPRPVSRERVEAAVLQLIQAWNERKLETVLADNFYDRQRLVDAVQSKVPRDARLRLVALQSWQIVDQYAFDSARSVVYSRISVTARTQLEFNDPAAGFQVRPGTNDFFLTIGEARR